MAESELAAAVRNGNAVMLATIDRNLVAIVESIRTLRDDGFDMTLLDRFSTISHPDSPETDFVEELAAMPADLQWLARGIFQVGLVHAVEAYANAHLREAEDDAEGDEWLEEPEA